MDNISSFFKIFERVLLAPINWIKKTYRSWLSSGSNCLPPGDLPAPPGHNQQIDEEALTDFVVRIKRLMDASWRDLPPDVDSGKAQGYTAPSSGNKYTEQFLWDSAAHIMINASLGDEAYLNRAAIEVRTLFAHQTEDGRLPHQAFWGKQSDINKAFYGVASGSKITQPALIGHALRDLYDAGKPEAVTALLPQAVKFLDYLENMRNLNYSGLPTCIHPYETGMDASPAFDKAFNSFFPGESVTKAHIVSWQTGLLANYKVVDYNLGRIKKMPLHVEIVQAGFCAIHISALEQLAYVYKMNGDTDTEGKLNARAQKLMDRMISSLWREDWGMFDDLVLVKKKYELSGVQTISGLLAICCKCLPADKAVKIKEKIFDTKKFNTYYPVPVVAIDEKTFCRTDEPSIWRGGVWGIPNALVIDGLIAHGFAAEAADLATRFAQMVYFENSFDFYERYDAFDGHGSRTPGFAWGTLAYRAVK